MTNPPLVLRGFWLFDTHGLPLAIQIEAARAKGADISIPAFYKDALKAGWAPEKAETMIRDAMSDTGAEEAYISLTVSSLKAHSG